MEYSGFFKPYPANRPLKDEERQRQLHQKQRLEVDTGDDVTVIRFNGTYLELMDKWLDSRGLMTFAAAMSLSLGMFVGGMFPYDYLAGNQLDEGWGWAAAAMALISESRSRKFGQLDK